MTDLKTIHYTIASIMLLMLVAAIYLWIQTPELFLYMSHVFCVW